MESPAIAVIGGSGLYQIDGLTQTTSMEMDTPFGKPSSPILVGTLAGKRMAFLARHGIGHFISPTEVNYRANIYALKSLGVQHIISVSACGSLRDDYAPGNIIIPDQLFDFTRGRQRSFFGEGIVAHISSADPFCKHLSTQLYQAVHSAGGIAHLGGSWITIEGPRFSTKAESNLYRSWGMAIIGMTACPEAFLAREAEMCYATMAHVTDYDVWHITEEPVSVDMVIRTLNKNTLLAQNALISLIENFTPVDCECQHALEDAILTRPEAMPVETRKKLAIFLDKYLKP